ncbi:ABC transporter substrate-binding protein [Salinicola avicenniae]|uniref:ABC transporter substrate-binding protein n=1 Tax=Salinicola avicenniae TaxID=2916836 RepID=UPI0020747F71|nr:MULTISPECIES: ABC transporter substrate-binding protein [unclassified Salinicola]
MTLSRRRFLQMTGSGVMAGALGWPALSMAQNGQGTPFAMQASWVNDAEFSGYFVAQRNGYYADEGLALDYRPGGPDVIPEGALLSNRAAVALTTVESTLKAVTQQGAPLVIIGTQYQKSPVGIVSLASNPIEKPEDLAGKVLAVPPVNRLAVEAMLAANGMSTDDVRIVPYAYDPTPLLKGEIDASLDFVTNVPYTIQLHGEEAVSFLLYDHGFPVFNDTLVVTRQTLESRRADLLAWLRASRRGWEENFQDPTRYPPLFADSFFAGNGRAIDNEIFFNQAQQPLIESPNGIFSMADTDIARCVEALGRIGIEASAEHFDTSLLAELEA